MPHLMDYTCEHYDEFRSEGWNFCGNCGKRLTNTCPGCPEEIRRGRKRCRWWGC